MTRLVNSGYEDRRQNINEPEIGVHALGRGPFLRSHNPCSFTIPIMVEIQHDPLSREIIPNRRIRNVALGDLGAHLDCRLELHSRVTLPLIRHCRLMVIYS